MLGPNTPSTVELNIELPYCDYAAISTNKSPNKILMAGTSLLSAYPVSELTEMLRTGAQLPADTKSVRLLISSTIHDKLTQLSTNSGESLLRVVRLSISKGLACFNH